ncbi:site-specific integrase [Burkholderia ubonensis]|uniref:site-specific integrase n=1 Tax=Burkholderia ubonensis TaxID=101571 RepID=UPI001E61DE2D|nr:site-specific integrase [Burkholderia ubonensis]
MPQSLTPLKHVRGTAFDLRFVTVAQVVDLIYQDAMRTPYVLGPDVLTDTRLVSFRLFAVASGDRITTIQKGFRAACARAGIDDFRVHDLRHTFASWLVMAGVSLYVVKDLLGHSSITVTERYAHLAPHMGREAVRTLHA